MEFKSPLLLDGATGTQLQKHGFSGSESAESWVLSHQDELISIQRAYIEAGSQVIYAPTFGANRLKLQDHGILGKTIQYNTDLVELSKRASEGKALVAGDISPCGRFIYPMGDMSFEELVDIYTEQALALENAGADLFAIETMITISDARAAVIAVKSVSSKPVFVTFTCDENGKTLTGSDAVTVLVTLQEMGIDAFGLNCGAGPEQIMPVLRRLKKYAKIPLIAKPNAGMPQTIDGKTVYTCTPDEFVNLVPEMAQCGVAIFGGCCGTDPQHIAALHNAVSNITPAAPGGFGVEYCSTERDIFTCPRDFSSVKILRCDETLEDELDDELDGDSDAIYLSIENEDDILNLSEVLYRITKPTCFVSNDISLLEKVLRLYQGRALYRGELSPDALTGLVEKYGLIIL